jgi:hypothetical protein
VIRHTHLQVRFPARGYLGLLLVGIFWPLNWGLPGLRTAYLFFPLWLGYILVVDALVWVRSGSSIWTRSRRDFGLLFFLSAPAWWLFELFNHRTRNWEYLGGSSFSTLEYYLLASWSFSTVMPAVFETAELFATFSWVQRCAGARRLRGGPRWGLGAGLSGLLMLVCVVSWPKIFYPLVWLSVFLILDPLNQRLGRHNLLDAVRQGDWQPVVALSAGALSCGVFWELWNYGSYPKWIYHTPGAQFLHVFEMPLLGYGGYVPFAWELYALRNFLWPGARNFRV